jgi:hypothetical protein
MPALNSAANAVANSNIELTNLGARPIDIESSFAFQV